jgi:hypothetical protein
MIDPILDDGYVRALAGLGALRSYAKNTVVFHEGSLLLNAMASPVGAFRRRSRTFGSQPANR